MAWTVGNILMFSCVDCGEDREEVRRCEGTVGGTLKEPESVWDRGSSSGKGEERKFEKEEERCVEKEEVKKPVRASSAAKA